MNLDIMRSFVCRYMCVNNFPGLLSLRSLLYYTSRCKYQPDTVLSIASKSVHRLGCRNGYLSSDPEVPQESLIKCFVHQKPQIVFV